jgi:hypothetical protein
VVVTVCNALEHMNHLLAVRLCQRHTVTCRTFCSGASTVTSASLMTG